MPERRRKVKSWSMEHDGDGFLIEGVIRVPIYEGYEQDARLLLNAPKMLAALRTSKRLLEAVVSRSAEFTCSDQESAICTINALLARIDGE